MAENDCSVTDHSNAPSGERVQLAMDALGQIEVLSNKLLDHANEDIPEMDSSESATIIRALTCRCALLANTAWSLLNTDDKNVGADHLEEMERVVSHG